MDARQQARELERDGKDAVEIARILNTEGARWGGARQEWTAGKVTALIEHGSLAPAVAPRAAGDGRDAGAFMVGTVLEVIGVVVALVGTIIALSADGGDAGVWLAIVMSIGIGAACYGAGYAVQILSGIGIGSVGR